MEGNNSNAASHRHKINPVSGGGGASKVQQNGIEPSQNGTIKPPSIDGTVDEHGESVTALTAPLGLQYTSALGSSQHLVQAEVHAAHGQWFTISTTHAQKRHYAAKNVLDTFTDSPISSHKPIKSQNVRKIP